MKHLPIIMKKQAIACHSEIIWHFIWRLTNIFKNTYLNDPQSKHILAEGMVFYHITSMCFINFFRYFDYFRLVSKCKNISWSYSCYLCFSVPSPWPLTFWLNCMKLCVWQLHHWRSHNDIFKFNIPVQSSAVTLVPFKLRYQKYIW
jgi:hypothetical protein